MTIQIRRSATIVVALSALALLMLLFRPAVTSGAPTPKFTQVAAAGVAVAGDLTQVIASCAEGYHVTGGGYEIAAINPALFVHQNTPLTPVANSGAWGWAVTILNETPGSVNFGVFALCARS